MKSYDLTADVVRALIGEQFPEWSELPVERVLPGGNNNFTFRLGDSMSVRLPKGDGYALQAEKEQEWLPRLAAELDLPIPLPLAKGKPTTYYPLPWSVNKWIEGDDLQAIPDINLSRAALDTARFLKTLQSIDPQDGPAPGSHNFCRGGDLAIYDEQTRRSIELLGNTIDGQKATEIWERALQTDWPGAPVWIHGDYHQKNMLAEEGRLSAVLDFGLCGVGDPACDLAIAWTFLADESRALFKDAMDLDEDTWLRGAAWVMWKALILMAEVVPSTEEGRVTARRELSHVFAEVG